VDANRFDRLTRSLSTKTSRRQTLAALLLGSAGLAVPVDWVVAGPGCKNVGRKCKRSTQCCSGVCKVKKGKNRCKAHDTGGCRAGVQELACGGEDDALCTTADGAEGVCDTTTGNAGFCTVNGACFPCAKDAECRPICGPRAACIVCADECADQGGTACVGPGECEFPDD
jgi:hypothetical protein